VTNNTHNDNLTTDSDMNVTQAMSNYDSLDPMLREFFRNLPVNIEVDADAVECMNESPYAYLRFLKDHFTKTVVSGALQLYGKRYPIDLIRV
jgi:hypothetical protein